MKKSILYKRVVPVAVMLLASSCNSFLDEMPDNRTEINSEDKIQKLLVSAYPENDYIYVTELSSDNVDDYTEKNPYSDRFSEQVFYWKDVNEVNNEDPSRVWSSMYSAIASANLALDAIEKAGNPTSLLPAKGEALICRAYAHFMLVNIFAKQYNKQTSSTDLGITYMEKSETTLNPKYKRESVAEIYGKIEKDLEAGLPLINDSFYKIPKYHFNLKAAHAFAARFYLYYEKWDKVISHANVVLTSQPESMLRDYNKLAGITRDFKLWSQDYASENNKNNLLLQTAYSNLGTVFGPYYTGSRFNHGKVVSANETIQATGPWGTFSSALFKNRPFIYSGTNLDKALFAKIPYMFEYTDPVAQIGFRRTVYVPFNTEEALLNRAEAYIMQKDFDNATKDLAVWQRGFMNTMRGTVDVTVTRATINSFYSALSYYTSTAPTIKKKINPKFTVEAGEQENFVQCLLHFRRLSTLHEGLRWFDVKRYGIEITRRQVDNVNGSITEVDKLTVNDERRAVQIPKDVVDAGYTPNPR